MNKVKVLRFLIDTFSSDIEFQINRFIINKEVINVSSSKDEDFIHVFIIYKS